MNKMLRSVFILIFLLPFLSRAQSLQPVVIASDGGYSVVTGGSLSWTLGEPMSETYAIVGNFLTQGFQQPSVLLVSTPDQPETNGLLVYPNPATDVLFVDPQMLNAGHYSVQVFDILGNRVIDEAFSIQNNIQQKWSLSLMDLSNGMYLIRITGKESDHTARFIKSN